MTEYDNSNRGALFKNDRKEKETQPDYKGSLNVGGVDYWVSSWISTSKAGAKYMSLSVTPKDEQKAPTIAEKAAASGNSATVAAGGEFDDDIPF
jgi:uncharacterized protein (DUF736 family)